VNALGHSRVNVCLQHRNALIKCICKEPTTLRYGQMTDVHRTNPTNSAASSPLLERSTEGRPWLIVEISPSIFGLPARVVAVASVVLVSIGMGVQMKSRKGGQT